MGKMDELEQFVILRDPYSFLSYCMINNRAQVSKFIFQYVYQGAVREAQNKLVLMWTPCLADNCAYQDK